MFVKKCSCIVFAKKTKVWDKKQFFSKKSKRGYKRLFFICFRQMSNERIQTSIIHIPPCSQKIIDNENPDFFTLFVLKMRNEAIWLLW